MVAGIGGRGYAETYLVSTGLLLVVLFSTSVMKIPADADTPCVSRLPALNATNTVQRIAIRRYRYIRFAMHPLPSGVSCVVLGKAIAGLDQKKLIRFACKIDH